MAKRNAVTDGFKQDADTIRQIFMDRFDGAGVLLYYRPFTRKRGPAPLGEKSEAAKDASLGRKLGGLAYTVAALNSLLVAGLLMALAFGADAAGFTNSPRLEITSVLALIAFGAAFWGQHLQIEKWEQGSRTGLEEARPKHAGGVVFRVDDDGHVRYLFVGPRDRGVGEWLLPKGKIEPDEGHREAALREVREESGVMARPICLLGRIAFCGKGKSVDVKFYLMESLYEGAAAEGRSAHWFSYAEALARSDVHDESKYLLAAAEQYRSTKASPDPETAASHFRHA
jgi:ADP-ribose pyrophosphatase YjhB (NUDIX family)